MVALQRRISEWSWTGTNAAITTCTFYAFARRGQFSGHRRNAGKVLACGATFGRLDQ